MITKENLEIYLIRNCFKKHNLKEIKFKYDLILIK